MRGLAPRCGDHLTRTSSTIARAAAQAFEAAGEFDRALELYKQLGQHERAGDLLRRIGEEEAAVAEYVAGGERAGKHDRRTILAPAGCCWKRPGGWTWRSSSFRPAGSERPAGNSTQCGLELARLHAGRRRDRHDSGRLLDRSRCDVRRPGVSVRRSLLQRNRADRREPALEAIAEEVRDRALQATARALRRGLENRRTAGTMVSKWLGRSKLWPAALVSDADFAVAAAATRPRQQPFGSPAIIVEVHSLAGWARERDGRVPGLGFGGDLPGVRARA